MFFLRRAWAAPVVLAGFALILLCVNGISFFEYLDDGASSYGAFRVLNGEMPYRDFMTGIAPGHFYFLALLFKFFSPSFMVERIAQAWVWALGVLAVYGVTAAISSRRAAWVSGALLIGVVGSFRHIPGGLPIALVSAAAAGVFLMRAMTDKKLRWAAAAAAASALSIFFRHDLGVLATVALLVTLGVFRTSVARGVFRVYGGVLLIALLLPGLFFLKEVPFSRLWFSFIEYPFAIYSKHSQLPYPPPSLDWTSLFYYGTPLLLGLGWWGFIRRAPWTAESPGSRAVLLYVLLTGTLFFNQVRLRADLIHVLSPTVAAVPLYGWMLEGLFRRPKARGLAWLACLPGLFLGVQAVSLTAATLLDRPPAIRLGQDLPALRGIRVPVNSPEQAEEFRVYEECLRYVRQQVPEHEKIFVGSTRQDRACYGDPAFYFIAGRGSATRHQELNRGVVTTAQTQREMVQELIRNRVKVVVLRAVLDRCISEPNDSSRSSGVREFDEYLREHFFLQKNFGGNLVLVRRDEAGG